MAIVSDVESGRSYCDWPAIFIGASFAVAFSFIMFTFGAGLGLSMLSAEPGEGVSMRWWAIAAGLWFIWVAVSSFGAGGYLAGRMRRPVADATSDEIETRDGVHGLTVWATGTLIATVLAMGGVGGLVSAGATATGTAAGGAAELVEEQGDYFASLILRDDAGASPSAEAQSEVGTILVRSVAEGSVSPADRDRLVQIVAAETGTQPAEVEQRVDEALSAFEQARQDAIEAVEQARIVGLITAFVLAATMVVSAAVAYFTATLGGQHRNEGIPLSSGFSLKRKL
jgi:hypothetical protein